MYTSSDMKQQHETIVIQAALKEHNRLYGNGLRVIARPDPPDAILSNGAYTTWLEHTDAFFSEEWAKALSTTAYVSIKVDMDSSIDAQFADVFCQRVLDKHNKESYNTSISRYGPGILVVGLESPWLNSNTLQEINNRWQELGKPDISTTFTHVYIVYRDQNNRNYAFEWQNK